MDKENVVTLREKLNSYLEKKYRVACRGDNWAQLWRPKRFGGLWFLLWSFLSFGWGGLFYIIYHISIGDRTVYIWIDADGSAHGYEYES